MRLLSSINTALVARATRIFLAVVSAAVILAACSGPAPESEQWPPAPRPTPTPGGMLVLPTPEPSALADEAYAVLKVLTSDHSPRENSTDQEMDAALYLQEQLGALGYDTSLQEFDSPYIISADLHLASDGGEPPMNTTASHQHPSPVTLSDASATGLLTFVGEALPEDIPDEGLEGRIVLIDLGTGTLDEQVRRVTKAGAVGAIILTADEHLLGAIPPYRLAIPVISLSSAGRHGPALMRLIEHQEVTASITVENEKVSSQNVVAYVSGSEGDARPPRRVILGAHYDTVEDTQGASDNGSGLSALLTVARRIAERDYPFDIRIVLFGAEENGLFGSRHYVHSMSQNDLNRTIVMLNFDALGSGTTLHAMGDFDLTSKAVKIGQEMGASITLEGRRGATSDHASFEEVGIPVLFLSSNDISRINAPEDTIEHINPDLLGYAAEIGIAMLDWLAMELEE